MARVLLLGTKLLLKFWKKIIIIIIYIRNRTLIGFEGKMPEEIYSSKMPYIGHLRTWGCLVYIRMFKEIRDTKLHLVGI